MPTAAPEPPAAAVGLSPDALPIPDEDFYEEALMQQCPSHKGTDWNPQGFHAVPGSNNPCNRQAILTFMFREQRMAIGMTDDATKPWIEQHLGKTFEGPIRITDMERCRLLYWIRKAREALAPAEPAEAQGALAGL